MKPFKLFLALILLWTSTALSAQTISVLYFTDAHEIMPVPYSKGTKGGVARLKTIADSISKTNKNTVVIFGGDLAGGTLFGKVYKGFPMVEALNQIPLDVANFGQHEFDFGVENTKQLVQKSKFQWITSNITNLKGAAFNQLPTHYIIEKGGVKIGFLGLTDNLDTSAQGQDLAQKDMIASASEAVKQLKSLGATYIIAMTQTPMVDNRELLDKVPGIDLIFTEENSEEITEIESLQGKFIVSTLGNIGSVAEAKISRRGSRFQTDIAIHLLSDEVKPEKKMAALAQRYADQLEQSLVKKVTTSTQIFDITTHRQEESALGNLIADAYRHHFSADFGFMNSGGIRSYFPKGNITLKDIFAVLPFDNKVGLVELSGKQIKEVLSQGLKNHKIFGGEFVQVSGLEYTFRVSADGTTQLEDVRLSGKELVEAQRYTVALPNYIIQGGGAFEELPPSDIRVSPSQAPIDADVFLEYLEQRASITPVLEGRIKIKKGK